MFFENDIRDEDLAHTSEYIEKRLSQDSESTVGYSQGSTVTGYDHDDDMIIDHLSHTQAQPRPALQNLHAGPLPPCPGGGRMTAAIVMYWY